MERVINTSACAPGQTAALGMLLTPGSEKGRSARAPAAPEQRWAVQEGSPSSCSPGFPPLPMPGCRACCRLWVSLGLSSPWRKVPQHRPWPLPAHRSLRGCGFYTQSLCPPLAPLCSQLAGPGYPPHCRWAAPGSGIAQALGCWSVRFGPTPLILGKDG